MPIYEYRCGACGDEFEVIQRISEAPPLRCKKCGGSLEKMPSRTAFLLKGSGWYADGYGGSAPKPEAGAGEAAPGKDGPAAKEGGSGPKPGGSSGKEGGSAPKSGRPSAPPSGTSSSSD